MTKIPGSFLVLFRPGVVSGIHNEREVVLRKIIINRMLDEVKNSPNLPRNGYAVVSDRWGNLKLTCSLRRSPCPLGSGTFPEALESKVYPIDRSIWQP